MTDVLSRQSRNGPTRGRYLLSLPERLFRSVVGLGAGLAREIGEVALPGPVRTSQLYHNVVDSTLRFLIERVGGVEGVDPTAQALEKNFLVRRTAGNAIEVLGLVAFRASPVWVLAALADVSGLGRRLIPEIAAALKEQGLLDEEATFASVDELLDGLERTSARAARAINTPPLDVAGLRAEWRAIREEARGLAPDRLPSPAMLVGLWSALRDEAARQGTSIYATSSAVALAALRELPHRARWLGESAATGARRAGRVLAGGLLDHYRQTLADVGRIGYGEYAQRQMEPYVRAAIAQFAPGRSTLTERVLERHTRNVT